MGDQRQSARSWRRWNQEEIKNMAILQNGDIEEGFKEPDVIPSVNVEVADPAPAVAVTGKKRTPWTAQELSVIDRAGPSAKAQDLLQF